MWVPVASPIWVVTCTFQIKQYGQSTIMGNSHAHQHGMKSVTKKPKTLLNSFLWHNNVPFKISFLIWRSLKGKLPTHENFIFFLKNSRINFFSNRYGRDTIEDIFNKWHFATYVGKILEAKVGITLKPKLLTTTSHIVVEHKTQKPGTQITLTCHTYHNLLELEEEQVCKLIWRKYSQHEQSQTCHLHGY